MANEAKSAAELAREERKARIGKAGDAMAEKREKKANQSKRQKRLKWIIPAVVIVIALVLGLLYYFGVPHRTLSVIKFGNGEKVSIGGGILTFIQPLSKFTSALRCLSFYNLTHLGWFCQSTYPMLATQLWFLIRSSCRPQSFLITLHLLSLALNIWSLI